MSDLQSDLRRLQEVLWPEPWRPSRGQCDDHDIYAGEVKVAGNYDHEEGGIVRREDRDALVELRNLLPRILTALAPAVKPFEWFECNGGNSWYAKTPFGDYTINREDAPYGGVVRYKWNVCFDEDHDEHEGEAPTLEAAQAAAWQHWSERIGGAIQ